MWNTQAEMIQMRLQGERVSVVSRGEDKMQEQRSYSLLSHHEHINRIEASMLASLDDAGRDWMARGKAPRRGNAQSESGAAGRFGQHHNLNMNHHVFERTT